MRVVVIGAGLGGLCLAHGLRQAGIDVSVFERSARAGDQAASYGIHLNADGLRALHAALPAENWDQLGATAVPARNVVRFHDPNRGVLATLDFETAEHATDPVTRRRAVSRGNLRDALLRGLDGHDGTGVVAWGREFVGYEESDDGRPVGLFGDGTRAVGDLLVGADGSNSRVRRQRLPGLNRLDLGILNVAGRVPVTPEVAAFLPPQLADSAINNVVPRRPGWMFVSTWGTGDTAATDLAGSERADRYIVWAWAAGADTYPNHGEGLTSEQLKDHVQSQIASWSALLRRLVDCTDVATIGPVPLRSMPQLDPWTPSAVTLLGDAIHNMTPMGGIGANTALRDAETLRQALIAHPSSLIDAVTTYETTMRGYANQALALSTRNAQRAADPRSRSRAAFRTVLRVAEAVPPIKRRLFRTPLHTVNG